MLSVLLVYTWVGILESVNEQPSVGDYMEMGRIRVPCVGCLGVWLVPFWLNMEDIRFVLFKDRVNVSSCLTQFIVQPLDPCVWQGLSLSPTS
jgi:hypothetical protein